MAKNYTPSSWIQNRCRKILSPTRSSTVLIDLVEELDESFAVAWPCFVPQDESTKLHKNKNGNAKQKCLRNQKIL